MTMFYRRNSKVEESPLQRDLMLFDPDKSKFFVLNPTMAEVWRGCDGAQHFEQIVEKIVASFSEAQPQVVKADVLAAIDELVGLGLIASIE
jgi:hypothetical protein